jgi:hypothetical protein
MTDNLKLASMAKRRAFFYYESPLTIMHCQHDNGYSLVLEEKKKLANLQDISPQQQISCLLVLYEILASTHALQDYTLIVYLTL